MADVSDLVIWFRTHGRYWVAATGRAPYFCFVGESEAAVEDIAARALQFYEDVAAERETFSKGRETVSPDYVVQKKVLGRELARS